MFYIYTHTHKRHYNTIHKRNEKREQRKEIRGEAAGEIGRMIIDESKPSTNKEFYINPPM